MSATRSWREPSSPPYETVHCIIMVVTTDLLSYLQGVWLYMSLGLDADTVRGNILEIHIGDVSSSVLKKEDGAWWQKCQDKHKHVNI
jgi:hypothetical protein